MEAPWQRKEVQKKYLEGNRERNKACQAFRAKHPYGFGNVPSVRNSFRGRDKYGNITQKLVPLLSPNGNTKTLRFSPEDIRLTEL